MDLSICIDGDTDNWIVLVDRAMSKISYKALLYFMAIKQGQFVSLSFEQVCLCRSPYHLLLASTDITLLAVNHNILYFFYMSIEYLVRHLSVVLDAYNIPYDPSIFEGLQSFNDINEKTGLYVISSPYCIKQMFAHMVSKERVLIYYSSPAQLRSLVNKINSL